MRSVRLWAALLGLVRVVVEGVDFDEGDGSVVVSVRLRKRAARRCGACGRRCAGYDRGSGRRRWRALDLGTLRAYVEADAPRVRCPDHGVITAQVPWARHGAGHTRAFDDQVAWLATHTSKTAVTELMRIAWRSVGAIIGRVVAEARAERDPFDGLVRIGIDEISYKRGHKYLMVVVDHDTGRLVWAAAGRDRATLGRFFDLLGDQRCAAVRLVSADAAEFIGAMATERCGNAKLCIDPFHVVAWATDALDQVRREVWNAARRDGQRAQATELKGARFALWKNPEDLTARQGAKLAWIARTNQGLYRAYLLKEQLRQVFKLGATEAIKLLDHWLAWARRCRLPAFAALAGRISKNRAGIEASLTFGLSNALVESTNTKIRLLTRVAFGFKDTGALIALALLDRGGYCPPLPGRQPT